MSEKEKSCYENLQNSSWFSKKFKLILPKPVNVHLKLTGILIEYDTKLITKTLTNLNVYT